MYCMSIHGNGLTNHANFPLQYACMFRLQENGNNTHENIINLKHHSKWKHLKTQQLKPCKGLNVIVTGVVCEKSRCGLGKPWWRESHGGKTGKPW